MAVPGQRQGRLDAAPRPGRHGLEHRSTPSSGPATSTATSASTSSPGGASTGELFLYPGNGTRRWSARARSGTGWNVFSALVGAGDVNGDGRADLLARERATGYLWLYPGNGTGGSLPRVRIGTGLERHDRHHGPR